MTARAKKQRNRNSAIKRAKNKVKELKKLKKTLGLIDEDGMDLMDKIKDITEQEKKKQELEKVKEEALEEIYKQETADMIDHNQYIEVTNEETKVKRIYNVKTKRDQFGSFPVWYDERKANSKQRTREGKSKKKVQFRGHRMHYIDRNCAWKNIV